MNKWFRNTFFDKGTYTALSQLQDFANKHNLKPGEFFVTQVGIANDVSIMYYAEKDLGLGV